MLVGGAVLIIFGAALSALGVSVFKVRAVVGSPGFVMHYGFRQVERVVVAGVAAVDMVFHTRRHHVSGESSGFGALSYG
jgi:hypothetical protein